MPNDRERLERVAQLAPKKIRKRLLCPKRELPRDVPGCVELEGKLHHFIQHLKGLEARSTDEAWLLSLADGLLQRVRAKLRSPALVLEASHWLKHRWPLGTKEQALFSQALKEARANAREEKRQAKARVEQMKAEAKAHLETYGPPAGSRARGPTNRSSKSVYTVQGGAPGLGKRS